jgi:geranylgeranyl diphosphate synthase type I
MTLTQSGLVSEQAEFEAALKDRRALVYDYLEHWPGVEQFKPDDIREGLYSYVRRRGKGLRPFLLLLSCAAVGGDEHQAVPAAAAVEIYHIWTMVHDDVIDRDDLRRGAPTVHAQYAERARSAYGLGEDAEHYGRTVAILAGDLQQSWSYALLGDLVNRGVSPAVVVELIRTMAASLTPALMEGELLDVQFALVPPDTLTEEQVLAMLGKKSAALVEYAAWCGARIGLGDRPDTHGFAERLGRFAYMCGTAFQIRDDLLGLTSDVESLGKPVGSDLREGKRTLVLYKALSMADEAQKRMLLAAVGNPHATQSQLEEATRIIVECGAAKAASDLASSLIGEALDQLTPLPDSPALRLLRAWAHFMLARQY